ncbi:MAG: T9SS type A sorting domain-containing protein [Candidatus Cloacimonetes bacterium]|nr:T9SS type A sorting domain-containing protein [Candidatus Cloacimonadota bacterium]
MKTLIFSFFLFSLFLPLAAVHDLTVNGGTDITITLTDSLHFDFEFEVTGNAAAYEFAIEILGQQIPLFAGDSGLFTDGGVLDETGIDGIFSGGFNNFMQLPAEAVLVITLTDEGISASVNISYEQLASDFSISGSVYQEGSWIDLPVFPAFVYCTYNSAAGVILELLENFDPVVFMEFASSGHYLLSDITGFMGDYQINIPDDIPDVTCGLGVISLLNDNDDYVAPNSLEVTVNGHLTGINFMYYQADGLFYGVVTNADAVPVAGAAFVLENPGSLPNYFFSDDTGNFSIPLLNNTYYYTVLAMGYEFYEGEVTIAGGDVYQEIILTEQGSGEITVSKDFFPGWNWFSLNILADDMGPDNVLAVLNGAGNYIKNQTGYATYYAGLGWFGSLSELGNLDFYQLDMNTSALWEFSGIPIDPVVTEYTLNTGWNWISYSPQLPEEINYALAGLGETCAYVKNQMGFSNYYTGLGWYGTITTLDPLKGYMVDVLEPTSFTYPLPEERRALTEIIEPEFNYRNYQYNGSLVLTCNDGSAPGRIIALHDGEICGSSTKLELEDVFGRSFYALMVYGNLSLIEDYELYYQASEGEKQLSMGYTFTFQADMRKGDCIEPIVISLPVESAEKVFPQSSFSVYPNPFNPRATIEFYLAESGEMELKVYNLKGQLVETLLKGHLEAGEHFIYWNADNCSSGLYLLRYESGGDREVKRLILLK